MSDVEREEAELKKVLEEYHEKFGEEFALMAVMCMSCEELTKELRECIDKGVPYKYEEFSDNIDV